jgi:hypothetical protein
MMRESEGLLAMDLVKYKTRKGFQISKWGLRKSHSVQVYKTPHPRLIRTFASRTGFSLVLDAQRKVRKLSENLLKTPQNSVQKNQNTRLLGGHQQPDESLKDVEKVEKRSTRRLES